MYFKLSQALDKYVFCLKIQASERGKKKKISSDHPAYNEKPTTTHLALVEPISRQDRKRINPAAFQAQLRTEDQKLRAGSPGGSGNDFICFFSSINKQTYN